ncbi:hypothetical protein ACH5RR_038817 [Cinchona calisaya]|uniref:Uncharacterized protein n=1 Tax=Cinchona calisaya TaxID=153742 RepID=A0ABD2XWE5_9GENT
MEGGEDDPLASLIIDLCQITPSQELKLQNCPFVRESDIFPYDVDSLPSQFSPTLTQPEAPGIVMVSPPDTDSDDGIDGADSSNDRSTPRENEEFQTPPEHHNLSSSSQEDLQPPTAKSIAAVDREIDGSDDAETVAIEDCSGENEVNVGNLGISETEKLEGGDEVLRADSCEGGNEVERIEGFQNQSKRFRVFEGESDELLSKKIRVSEENLNSETKTVCLDETEITKKVDDLYDDEEEEELIYLDVDQIDEGIGFDEGKTAVALDSAEEESEVHDGVSDNGEIQKNGGGVSDGESDCEGETKKVNYDRGGGVGNSKEEEEGVGLDGGGNSVGMNGGLVAERYEEGIRENGNDKVLRNGEENFGCGSIGETEKFKFKDKARRGVDIYPGEKGVGIDGGEKSSLINGNLVVEASEVASGRKCTAEIRKNSEEFLSCRNIDEIEQFKYKGGGDNGGDQCWKEVVQRRRELPLSLREKGNDVGEKRKVDVKNLSWKELLDVVASVLGKANDESEDVDFLEAAKRKGMTFPQPRWI